MSLPRLIGITGKAGVGKDTLADALVAHFGFTKYSLAAPLKQMLNARFGWTMEDWADRRWKEAEFLFDEESGCTYSPRQLAQWLGTEVVRNVAGEDAWVNMMEREWFNGLQSVTAPEHLRLHMVVPDVRFDNEARRILQLGGVVIRVERSAAQAVAAHVSERGVDDQLVNVRVTNDGDIDQYLTDALNALRNCPRGA